MSQAQLMQTAAASDVAAELLAFDASLAAFRALREAQDASLTAGAEAKETLATALNATMWATVDYIATMPEGERAEASDTLAKLIAEAGQMEDANARQTKSRLGKACGDFLPQVLATDAEGRAKAGPHSVVAKLERLAKKAAAVTAEAEAAAAEVEAYAEDAFNLIAAESGMARAIEVMVSGKDPAARADAMARAKMNRQLIQSFGDWRKRAELRAWLDSFAEADAAEKAASVAEAEKEAASLAHARANVTKVQDDAKAAKAAALEAARTAVVD